MPPERAVAVRHLKSRSKRQCGSDLERARTYFAGLNGLRSLSLRRTVRASGAASDQLLRLDGRDFVANRLLLRRLAWQLLHLQPTGAPRQLSNPAKVAQDRADKTL